MHRSHHTQTPPPKRIACDASPKFKFHKNKRRGNSRVFALVFTVLILGFSAIFLLKFANSETWHDPLMLVPEHKREMMTLAAAAAQSRVPKRESKKDDRTRRTKADGESNVLSSEHHAKQGAQPFRKGHTNEKVEDPTHQAQPQPGKIPEQYPVSSASIQPAKSDKAYAFFLGGIPAPPVDGTNMIKPLLGNGKPFAADSYRGLLYNILVSVKTLRDSGSTADMILFVHMATANTELTAEHARWLKELGIRIQYVPTAPSVVNEFSTIVFEKFRILDLTEYKRVVYMDADVTPHCNLDYIMDLSMGDDPLLNENLIVSIGRQPASGGFFMLAPGPGKFARLVKTVADTADSLGWRVGAGWGKTDKQDYAWRSLDEKFGTDYLYIGANSDVGLLHYWTKMQARDVSIVIGDMVENWKGGLNVANMTDNPLKEYSCLLDSIEAKEDRSLLFENQLQEELMSPKGNAPYRDFYQWGNTEMKPWHLLHAPLVKSVDEIKTPVDRWFHALRALDHELQLGLNFKDSRAGTSGQTAEANWWYVEKKDRINVKPSWSTTVKAAHQWALRIVDNPQSVLPWQPAELLMPALREPLCTCAVASPVRTDPCSQPHQTLEHWLRTRSRLFLSAERPLCPHAARNKIHVVVPVGGLSDDDARESICSVLCQDYPPEKVSVSVYDNGSNQRGFLQSFCGKHALLSYDPLKPSSAGDFEDLAKRHASESFRTHDSTRKGGQQSDFNLITCLRPKSPIEQGDAQYWALRHVEAQAGANDVVLVLDEGDELAHRALHSINENFTRQSAWSLFGSFGTLNLLTQSKFNPRQFIPPASLGSPLGFKSHLLGHVRHEDFSGDRGSARRGYFYRMLELSGANRIAVVSPQVSKQHTALVAQTNQVLQSKPSIRLELPLEVVLTCSSPVLIREQLAWLQEQTLASLRNISVHLLIESPQLASEIEGSVNHFLDEQVKGRFKDTLLIGVNLLKDFDGRHSCSNYLYVKQLLHEKPLDHVVLLDGNQYWPPTYLSVLTEQHLPRGMTTWSGKRFESQNPNTKLGFYANSSLSFVDILNAKKMEESIFTVLESEGSIFDANLWLLDRQLDMLQDAFDKSCDLWVSYILDALLGWRLRRLKPDVIPVNIPEFDTGAIENQGYKHLPEGQGRELKRLRQTTADQLTKRPKRELGIEAMERVFAALQSNYSWQVLNRPKTQSEPLSIVPQTGHTINDETAVSRDETHEKRAFVCVTGQFDRFEAQSKVDSLFAPLQQAGYKVDVALILSHAGETSFTNQDVKERKKIKTDTQPFYDSFEQAAAEFERNGIKVLYRQNGTYTKVQDPPFHEGYFEPLFAVQGREREQQTARVLNHARIFDSYVRCLKYADGASMEATGKPVSASNPYYDVLIRIRDDVGFSRPLTSEVLKDVIPPPPNSMVVTPCRGWEGINDRFAIVGPDSARTYFERPYDVLSTAKFVERRVVRNPESFLLYVYTTAGINVLAHPDLRNLNRMYKSSSGQITVNTGDARDGCPKSKFYTHLDRLLGLYNWYM